MGETSRGGRGGSVGQAQSDTGPGCRALLPFYSTPPDYPTAIRDRKSGRGTDFPTTNRTKYSCSKATASGKSAFEIERIPRVIPRELRKSVPPRILRNPGN
ncbi:hypothetical protein P12x_002757 [Tundrisphaera lichenicola]|uniref:hypothetical protein n=1 Tax=Tundrisphaera lichenicola TaxID=2029860 RepID=UPI003EB6AA87